jgi:hypothetical protein
MTTTKEKSLPELAEFYVKDLNKPNPTLVAEDVAEEWNNAMRQAIFTASLKDKIEYLHIIQEMENYDIEKPVYDAIREELMDDVIGRLDQLEKTVYVLLKQHENDSANISVGQLNRLKGGYTP